MIRFVLKLLPEDTSGADPKVIASSNQAAKHAHDHLKKLIGRRKCRKHPSSPNKIRVYAVMGGDPKAELLAYCCPEFLKRIK